MSEPIEYTIRQAEEGLARLSEENFRSWQGGAAMKGLEAIKRLQARLFEMQELVRGLQGENFAPVGEYRPRRIMVDLETLGRHPGCVILAIGAVEFDEITGDIGKRFYTHISRASCTAAGLFEDAETLAWWADQSDEAKAVLHAASKPTAPELAAALNHFAAFLKDDDEVWGNGSEFDNAFLASAFRAAGMPTPWDFWNNRCYRTLKNLRPDIPLERVGTYHNALDDAQSQAVHAIKLLRALKGIPDIDVTSKVIA